MKLPLLAEVYPFSDRLAELHHGWTEGKLFKRTFEAESIQKQIVLVNSFLREQGFDNILAPDVFNVENSYEEGDFIFHKNLIGPNQIVLVYEQPLGFNPLNEMMKFLDSFRSERDWKKFHTSKNLSMAIGSEAGELIDLFL